MVLLQALIIVAGVAIPTVGAEQIAQAPTKTARAAFLASGSATSSPTVDAFRRALQDPAQTEGQALTLDICWVEGRFERLPELATDLVRGNPDVIVTAGPMALFAARRATSAIPIVMIACDPAETIVERSPVPAGT